MPNARQVSWHSDLIARPPIHNKVGALTSEPPDLYQTITGDTVILLIDNNCKPAVGGRRMYIYAFIDIRNHEYSIAAGHVGSICVQH